MLAEHKKEDIWMALNGMVYNITAYIPFHPGGEKELLRGAGKDGTKLFNATHPWVNIEGMLEECLIGILVSEEEASVSRGGESSLEMVD
jgi:cytochrome b involved in lipid metabolism